MIAPLTTAIARNRNIVWMGNSGVSSTTHNRRILAAPAAVKRPGDMVGCKHENSRWHAGADQGCQKYLCRKRGSENRAGTFRSRHSAENDHEHKHQHG